MKLPSPKILGLLVFVGLLIVNYVNAGFVTGSIVPCTDNCNICHFWQLASNITNFISFNLAIPAATVLFLVAGFLFLISGGNEKRIALAKSIFINVIIGLFIIFCSWLIVDTLFKTLATGEFSGAWNQFPICQ